MSYVTLTSQGGKEIGVALKPKPMSGVRLDTALAVGGYCFLEENTGWRRRRMLPEEVHQLAGGFAANMPHVITSEFGEPVVLRAQLATTGKPKAVLTKAAETFDKISEDPSGRAWTNTLQYGVVLLGHTPERVAQLQEAANGDSRFKDKRIAIGLGPTSETLAAVLRKRRKR